MLSFMKKLRKLGCKENHHNEDISMIILIIISNHNNDIIAHSDHQQWALEIIQLYREEEEIEILLLVLLFHSEIYLRKIMKTESKIT